MADFAELAERSRRKAADLEAEIEKREQARRGTARLRSRLAAVQHDYAMWVRCAADEARRARQAEVDRAVQVLPEALNVLADLAQSFSDRLDAVEASLDALREQLVEAPAPLAGVQ